MGEIYLRREERDALKTIAPDMLDKLIEQCLDEKQPSSMRELGLGSCGPYAASQLRAFEKALAEYRAAKAAKKLTETETRARRAGSDLAHAVHQMKHRAEMEEKEVQLFYVDDQIMPPLRFSEHLSIRVSFRWRRTIEDQRASGSITFSHDVDLRSDYTMPRPTRKPGAIKQERDRQDKLYRDWEHLMRLGLHSVIQFFREGGNATAIPETFPAKADPYSRELNNFSTRFWLVRS